MASMDNMDNNVRRNLFYCQKELSYLVRVRQLQQNGKVADNEMFRQTNVLTLWLGLGLVLSP